MMEVEDLEKERSKERSTLLSQSRVVSTSLSCVHLLLSPAPDDCRL